MANYDIIVIGAGVAGLSAAYFLSEHANVLVLEREEQPATHASGRSAALYIEGYENEVVSRLTSAGKTFFEQPPQAYCDAPLLHPRGGLTAATHGDEAKVAAFLARWQPLCPNLVELSPSQALELVPQMRSSWLSAACFDPDWRGIDVHELIQTFTRGLRARGGGLVTNAHVTGLEHAEGRFNVAAANDVYTAELVVNAAGAWAGEVGLLAGLDSVPLQAYRRTAVLLPLPEGAAEWPLVHAADASFYFKPEGSGLMVSPSDEIPSAPVDAMPEELDIAITVDRYQQAMEGAPVQRVEHSWAGLRTFAPDRYPVVGRDPRLPGFYWLAGQGGFGVQTAPGVGGLVAQNVLSDLDLDPEISVSRFL